LTCLFLCGVQTAQAIQLDSPIKFQAEETDKLASSKANETNGGNLSAGPHESVVDLLMLQHDIKRLISVTKELREAQDQIDARIIAIESRLNSQAASRALSNTRLWKSTAGNTIIATLTEVKAEEVVLTRDGKRATIPLKHLCPADREFVAAQAAKMSLSEAQRADIRELGVIR
jgi:hypothetical protein